MIGVLVVTHGDFGMHLLGAAQTILGPQDQCESMSVDATLDMNGLLTTLKASAVRLDTGDGLIILTDMFGGTPSNISLSLLQPGKIEILTGANLPMLLKTLTSRAAGNLNQLAADAKAAGVQGIVVAGEVLRRKVNEV